VLYSRGATAATAAAAPNDADTPPRELELPVRDICTSTQSRRRGKNFRNPTARQFVHYMAHHSNNNV